MDCKLLCLGTSAIICKELVSMAPTLTSDDRAAYPWLTGPAPAVCESSASSSAGSLADDGLGALQFFSRISRERVIAVCKMLEAIIPGVRDAYLSDWRHEDSHAYKRLFCGLFDRKWAPRTRNLNVVIEELEKLSLIWDVDAHGEFKYPRSQTQHRVDDLLIYKTDLVAITFSGATDNSNVVENEANLKIMSFF